VTVVLRRPVLVHLKSGK